jgi:Tfp pilus assembly protein PilE
METKRIDAYTLMEVTVAMLLAAVCISICYTAYGLIGNYFREFQNKNAVTQDVLMLNSVMDRDFAHAKYLIRTDDGISVESSGLPIVYIFETDAILRKVADIRIDSFKLQAVDLNFSFKSNASNALDTIDLVSFNLERVGQKKIPVAKWKRYSAQDLLK